MATTVVRRATAMPDSDQAENNKLTALLASGWIISGAIGGANATCASISAFHALVQGAYVRVAASASLALTGTVATSATGAYIVTLARASTTGTLQTYICGGASVAAITLPTTIPATEIPVGIIVVACTATGFNGGTNSLGDSSYTVSVLNFTGPGAIAMSTEAWSNVPG